MSVKRSLAACACLLLCAAVCRAQGGKTSDKPQARPDLSGTWVADKSKSRQSRAQRDKPLYDQLTLIIVHREPEVRVTRVIVSEGQERRQQLVYYTDGRGERNPTILEGGVVESKTAWDGRRLVTRWSNSERVGVEAVHFDTADRWEVSSDGRKLTRAVSTRAKVSNPARMVFVPAGPAEFKTVFNRAP